MFNLPLVLPPLSPAASEAEPYGFPFIAKKLAAVMDEASTPLYPAFTRILDTEHSKVGVVVGGWEKPSKFILKKILQRLCTSAARATGKIASLGARIDDEARTAWT